MPPARGVKSRCSFHILQQKVRFAASLQVVAVGLRRRNFAKQRFHHRNRKLSLLSGRIDNGASSIRHESTRSERKTGRVTRDLSANWGLFKTT
jgi:hypothetical protein